MRHLPLHCSCTTGAPGDLRLVVTRCAARWLMATRQIKRRGRDSNPWSRLYPLTGLANRRFRPLSHLSKLLNFPVIFAFYGVAGKIDFLIYYHFYYRIIRGSIRRRRRHLFLNDGGSAVSAHSTRNPRSRKAVPIPRSGRPPEQTYADFPLTPHVSGKWMKEIRGQIHRFGAWAKRG